MSNMPTNPYAGDLGGNDPIQALAETPGKIRAAVGSLTPEQFERSYAPGKWTARQILIHLAQSELALGNRARMAVSTPNYAAQSFDQDAWMTHDANLTGREALDAFVALATMNRGFFSSISAADRGKSLGHPEYGTLTVGWILEQLAGHQIHHLKQLEAIGRG